MSSTAEDLRYLQAVSGVLETFLLSKEIFFQLGALGTLSLGSLLLAMRRLDAQTINDKDRQAVSREEQEVRALRDHWRTHWEAKAGQEFRSRLRQWRHYLEEYRADPGATYRQYPGEVHLRTILKLLEAELPSPPEGRAELARLDALLQKALVPGEFILEPPLAAAFEKTSFWFLYGMPRAGGDQR